MMFEFHGWIKLVFTEEHLSEQSDDTEKGIVKVRKIIDDHKDPSTRFEVFYQQGKPFIRFDGYLPHYCDWVLKLFYVLGETANYSDGVMFIKDQDNPLFENKFRVWQMSCGEVLSGEVTFFPDVLNDIHQEFNQSSMQ